MIGEKCSNKECGYYAADGCRNTRCGTNKGAEQVRKQRKGRDKMKITQPAIDCIALTVATRNLQTQGEETVYFMEINEAEGIYRALGELLNWPIAPISEEEAMLILGGVGNAVGGVEAEIAQHELDAELGADVYKKEKEL